MGNQNGKGTVEFWSLADEGVESAAPKEEAAGCDDHAAPEKPVEEKKPREIKPFHVVEVNKPVRGIDFTEDGRRFVIACSDGSLRSMQCS